MCAVRGTESIVYKEVGNGTEVLGELFAVLCLFGTEAGVLKKNNIAVLHLCNGFSCIVTYDCVVISKNYILAENFCETYRYRCK